MIVDVDVRKIREVVRKTCAERRKIILLKDVKIRNRFEENVTKLMLERQFCWTLLGWVLKACDEVYGKKSEK